MGLRRTGDWGKVALLVNNIAREVNLAAIISVKRWSLKAEAIAKTHMSKQDLNWEPLKPSTIARKVRKGFSENILIETSTYFQSITSWADEAKTIGYAGVRRKVMSEDGEELADIAALHEFGSRSGNVPARPLWEPTLMETRKWYFDKKVMQNILKLRLKKYGV